MTLTTQLLLAFAAGIAVGVPVGMVIVTLLAPSPRTSQETPHA